MFGNLAAALGIMIESLFFLACIVILHSRVSRQEKKLERQQKELERLSQHVTDLRMAEHRRFLAELRVEEAAAEARQQSSPPIQIVR
jgi:hypothetical protein